MSEANWADYTSLSGLIPVCSGRQVVTVSLLRAALDPEAAAQAFYYFGQLDSPDSFDLAGKFADVKGTVTVFRQGSLLDASNAELPGGRQHHHPESVGDHQLSGWQRVSALKETLHFSGNNLSWAYLHPERRIGSHCC